MLISKSLSSLFNFFLPFSLVETLREQKKNISLVGWNFDFQNYLSPYLAWANGKGRHWSHILTKNNSLYPKPKRKTQGTS
jgi:hypothetical protein